MARPSAAATRNLTLTEELEKLEQSITLTLQEIDHNFSRAHRIVTTSILPIVEQYAKHSEAVWEGSKFWKQFFEASANVSLSGYEEATLEDSSLPPEESEPMGPSQAYASPMKEGDETITSPGKPEHESTSDNEEILSSPSMAHAHSTPRMPATVKQKLTSIPAQPQFAEYPSPYEQLKREIEGKAAEATGKAPPVTPGKGQILPDMSMTPDTSPFVIHKNGGPSTAQKNADAILHHGILNKTYRVAATPHTARKTKPVVGTTPATANRTRRAWIEDSLSSPNEPSPQLRAEIFNSPFKGPRTPGVSVVTPAAKKRFAGADLGRPVAGAANGGDKVSRAEEMTMSLRAQWDEDDEEELEMSPPKTIHFSVPQSQVLRTPAQEASKRIMEDLLLTAGGDITEELDEEDSPSIVQRNRELDETF